jgi:hypothetical protein
MKTKHILFLIWMTLLNLSCDNQKEDTYLAPCGKIVAFNACGVNDIGNNLTWLNDIINSSKNDKTGNYIGRIWFKRYNNQDVIVNDMALGSGGLAYHSFNCSGVSIVIEDTNFYSTLTQRDIIWTNICID